MSDKKYLVLEQHKFSSFKDQWIVKFANLDEDKAFEKLVALRTLNEDKEKIYYIVSMEYLWTKEDEPLVLTDEVKDNQDELPF
jgi:hypothetical protein